MERLVYITSGNGPVECQWVVAKVLKIMIKDALEAKLQYSVIHNEPGTENGMVKSVVFQLYGEQLSAFLLRWKGLFNGLEKVISEKTISGKTGLSE